ncbi:transposase [Desulfosarcina ovata]|uniref:transposase n=1 Tax=Desulfosarcina ovata TaxID=83564 RepID=UPI0012D357FE
MPRKSRIDAPGALQHIILRGINRRKIFFDDFDRDDFLDRLGGILADSKTPCYAWALMTNHTHLLLRTGTVPIATVMRRLLTGYAVSFNRRHRRSGHLFQNRYKSILCEEDPYLLELVRYIHLNPLRAGIVDEIKALNIYPYCGHSVIMGNVIHGFHNIDYVLNLFGETIEQARRHYLEFVKKGISQGRRPDLTGGGLVRSAGGWAALRTMRKGESRIKGDERILGQGDFVDSVLQAAQENLDRKYMLLARGYDFQWLVERVTGLFGLTSKELLTGGKQRKTVTARSVLCYWATRELGMSAVAISKRLNIAASTASESAARGLRIVEEQGFKLSDEVI